MIDAEIREQFLELDLKNIERSNLGPFNFESSKDKINEIVRLFSFLLDKNNPELPEKYYKNIENDLKEFLNLINQIQIFNPKTIPDAGPQHQNLIDQIESKWMNIFDHFYSLYSYISLRKGGMEDIKNELNISRTEFDKALKNIKLKNKEIDVLIQKNKNDFEEAKEVVEQKIQDASEFNAKHVVTEYGKIFDGEAAEHLIKIKKWWKLVISLIVGEMILASFLIFLYINFFKGLSLEASISFAALKLFILSAGALFISQSIKNLNAHNHLYTINRFRANALNSFKAFLASTDDRQTIDALIIQVAKAIYDPNISGYLSKDDSSTSLTNIEIIKKMVSGK